MKGMFEGYVVWLRGEGISGREGKDEVSDHEDNFVPLCLEGRNFNFP